MGKVGFLSVARIFQSADTPNIYKKIKVPFLGSYAQNVKNNTLSQYSLILAHEITLQIIRIWKKK
jgi:hypothetical protein